METTLSSAKLQPLLQPFYRVVLPILPPGINQSYQPAITHTGEMTLVHTDKAKIFLEEAAWQFRNQDNILLFDTNVFHTISYSRQKIALDVTITIYFKSLWQRDIDGPDKIILDALFNHLKFLADYGTQKQWNDNRVTALHVYKAIDKRKPRVEIEVRCSMEGM